MNEKMDESLSSCLGMAVAESANKEQFVVWSKKNGFKQRLKYKENFTFAAQDEDDLEPGTDLKWVRVSYTATFMCKESEILASDLEVILQLVGGIEVVDKHELVLNEEADEGQKRQAELQLINRRTFDLVQKIQKAGVPRKEKQEAYEEIQNINRNLDAKMEQFMAVKDRQLKKNLIQGVHECKARASGVVSVLRGLASLDHLNNETIAKLNDLAFKGIQKGSLQKMLDKRALQNEEVY